MTTDTLTAPPMPGLAPADPRAAAQATLDAAVVALDNARRSIEQAKAAKQAAQVIIDNAKPSIMLAEANVTIAKAHLLQFGAAPRGESDKVTCEMVVGILQVAEGPMTVADINAALVAQGVHAPLDNLKTYMSRWAASGAVLKADKANRLEPARYYARLPLVVGDAPSMPGLVPTGATPLPEDFPAREALVAAGFHTVESVPNDFDVLFALDGIGKATANAIVKALG